jgi:hypothetical protein
MLSIKIAKHIVFILELKIKKPPEKRGFKYVAK